MAKKMALILGLLVLALVASGCSTSSSTATGIPCTTRALGCYYYISNGNDVPCRIGIVNYCKNTTGDFYEYVALGKQTRLCESHVYGCIDSKGTPAPVLCSPKFTYNDPVNYGQAWQVVNRQTDQNTTPGPITVSFTSTSATTVSTSASIDLSADAYALLGAIFVSVHAQINASVAKTASTVVGNAVRVSIPAGMTANGIYGVRVQVTKGHLYQSNTCGSAKPDYGNVEAYVPIASGWCVWLSGQTPCRIVSGS
jgi:hypothetical protein